MRNIKNLFILLFISISTIPCFAVDKIQVNNIRVELKANPVGLDVLKPRFSWKIISKTPNTNQLAYRIMVAESRKDILNEKNLIWDTKIRKDSSSLFVQYHGAKLLSRKTYFWKIKVYTNQGESNWAYGHWSMAFLN